MPPRGRRWTEQELQLERIERLREAQKSWTEERESFESEGREHAVFLIDEALEAVHELLEYWVGQE